MAKNQIVITLKPEQIEELQRLAEAGDAKSVSVFAKQLLLASLEIKDKKVTSDASSQKLSNLKMLAADLKRIHNELRAFVTESQTNFDAPLPQSTIYSTTAGVQDLATTGSDYPGSSFAPASEDSQLPSLEEVVRMFEESQKSLKQFESFNKFIFPADLGTLGTPGELQKTQQPDEKDPLEALLDIPGKSTLKGTSETAANSAFAKMPLSTEDLKILSQTGSPPPVPQPPPNILPPDTDLSGGPPPKKRQ